MFSFGNFARMASLCVSFDLGTLHGYFFHRDFCSNLNFSAQASHKTSLNKILLNTKLLLANLWTFCRTHDSKFYAFSTEQRDLVF